MHIEIDTQNRILSIPLLKSHAKGFSLKLPRVLSQPQSPNTKTPSKRPEAYPKRTKAVHSSRGSSGSTSIWCNVGIIPERGYMGDTFAKVSNFPAVEECQHKLFYVKSSTYQMGQQVLPTSERAGSLRLLRGNSWCQGWVFDCLLPI